MRAADLARRPLADKFLHGTIVPTITYQCAKFQFLSWISSGDMEGVLRYKLGAAVLPTRSLAE